MTSEMSTELFPVFIVTINLWVQQKNQQIWKDL